MTLAHFGFAPDGSVLADEALPAVLTAEWLADADTKDKPYPSYARMLSQRGKPAGDGRYSWTVDFAAKRAHARAEMAPLVEKANGIKAEVVTLKERLKRLKKDAAPQADMDALEADIRDREKAARDLEIQAASIEAAVFDLKAVNPNAVTVVDERTPSQIIQSIQEQGRIVSDALARLNALLVSG